MSADLNIMAEAMTMDKMIATEQKHCPSSSKEQGKLKQGGNQAMICAMVISRLCDFKT